MLTWELAASADWLEEEKRQQLVQIAAQAAPGATVLGSVAESVAAVVAAAVLQG